ncbi:MAG: hemagglutinin-related protein [Candidatus Saccharibacteria bacterium]|nr:hemagglutinin-related protein [Candidatus Saccharibacteria bacterium]
MTSFQSLRAKSLLTFLTVLTVVGLSTGTGRALSGNEFSAGNIIDDAIFFNSSSMSVDQIQNFLNAKVPSCRSGYTCLKNYTQDTQTRAAETQLCAQYDGGTKSSAQIIFDVSKACGVNPQVLLVLLQKEQSLVTDTWPEDIQYRSATGFGCPDTAPCDAEYYGFFNQVYNAARIYKRYARDANQYNYRSGRNNNILYNPNSSCGSSSVYLQNQATAGLYTYTPYQPNLAALNNLYGTGDGCSAYGNRNFWRMFNDWFGSTHGSLIRTVTSGDLYYSDGQERFIIPSMNLAAQYGLGNGDVRFVTQQQLDATPVATSPYSDRLGTVVKSNDDSDADGGALYLVDNGSRIPIASLQQFTDLGFSSSSITYLPLTTIQRLSLSAVNLSNFVQAPDNSIYKIGSGQKQAIFELSKLSQLDPSGALTRLSDYTLSIWNNTTPLVDGDYGIIGTDGGVRVYNGANYYSVPSMNVYGCWGLSSLKTFVVPSYDLTNGTKVSDLRCAAQDSTSAIYLLDNGTRYPITQNGAGLSPVSPPDSLITRLSQGNIKSVIKGSGSELSSFEAGKARPILSMDAFFKFGFTGSDIQTLDDASYNIIPKGAKKLTTGTLLLEPSGAVSIANTTSSRLQVTSIQQFAAYGYDWNGLVRVNSTDLAAFPSSGNLSSYIKIGTDVYFVDGRVRYLVPSAIDSNLGLTRSALTPQGSELLMNTTLPWTMTKFIKSSNNPAVYELIGGLKHPLASWDVYMRESGNRPQDLVILTPDGTASFNTDTTIY